VQVPHLLAEVLRYVDAEKPVARLGYLGVEDVFFRQSPAPTLIFTEKFIKFLQLTFLSRDESDELGEGDFYEVAFADGSSMKPRATEGMRSRRSGAGGSRGRREADSGELEITEHERR
jgi:hypothetical protein